MTMNARRSKRDSGEDQLLLPDDAFWNLLDPPPDKRGSAVLGIMFRGSTDSRTALEDVLMNYCTIDWMSTATLATFTHIPSDLSWVIDETCDRLIAKRLVEKRGQPSIDAAYSRWEYRTADLERRRRIRKEGVRSHDVT